MCCLVMHLDGDPVEYWLLTVGSDMLSEFLIVVQRGSGKIHHHGNLLTFSRPSLPTFMVNAEAINSFN